MKNMYYEWKHDYKYAVPYELFIPETWKDHSLFIGNKINKTLPPMQLLFEEKKELSDSIPSSNLLLFFNKELVLFINEFYSKKLFQTFPVEIKTKGKEKITDPYFLINILNTKDVIDKEKSDLVTSKHGYINDINRLYIKENEFENNDFFRLDGYASLLICSQLFVDRITERGFKGMKFIPTGKERI